MGDQNLSDEREFELSPSEIGESEAPGHCVLVLHRSPSMLSGGGVLSSRSAGTKNFAHPR